MESFWTDLINGEAYAWKAGFAVYLVVVICISLYKSMKIRRWSHTQGTLTEQSLESWGGRKPDMMYSTKVRYEYEVDGQQYRGTRLSPFIIHATFTRLVNAYAKGIQKLGGDQVVVYYNPSRPAQSYLILQSIRLLVCCTLVVVLCLLLLWLA